MQAAHTPEELDTLFEDAFVVPDAARFAELFDHTAVLAMTGGSEARGNDAIRTAFAALVRRRATYVAAQRRLLRAGDTALIVARAGIHVARRGPDGGWRAAISLIDIDEPNEGEYA